MERRELDKQIPGQADQPGETGSSRQCWQDGHVPAWGALGPGHHRAPSQARVAPAVPPEKVTLAKKPVQFNYSFHDNKRKKSNKSSSLQTRELSKSPGAELGECGHTQVTAQGWHKRTPVCQRAPTPRGSCAARALLWACVSAGRHTP